MLNKATERVMFQMLDNDTNKPSKIYETKRWKEYTDSKN